MNTKIIMTSSALFLGMMGILLSFLPDEIGKFLNVESSPVTNLFLKLMSALYLGFALLNWMSKGTLIGGIYNRPIAIGNFMHFVVGAITLIKVVSSMKIHAAIFISLTVIYSIFAILFAFVFRTNPAKTQNR